MYMYTAVVLHWCCCYIAILFCGYGDDLLLYVLVRRAISCILLHCCCTALMVLLHRYVVVWLHMPMIYWYTRRVILFIRIATLLLHCIGIVLLLHRYIVLRLWHADDILLSLVGPYCSYCVQCWCTPLNAAVTSLYCFMVMPMMHCYTLVGLCCSYCYTAVALHCIDAAVTSLYCRTNCFMAPPMI